jgi:excisionase family DNA binding protein
MPKKVEYVTAAAAAALTGLHERTIRRKIADGTLRAEQAERGAAYAIRRADLVPLMRQVSPTLEVALARIQELEAE